MAAGLTAAALVIAGVVSLSTVLYLGFFGGMILMHVGGHGGHASHGGHETDEGQSGDPTPNADDLSHGSHGFQLGQPRSDMAPEGRPSIKSNGIETQDHDQHTSHGCH